MTNNHKNSFLIILSLLFISPLFFVPGGALSLETAKSALLLFGIVLATLVFIFETWREGRLVFPKSKILLVVALLPAVYLLSALLSTPSSLSLLGYNFEVSTFGFMLLGSVLMLLSSAVISTSRALQVLTALFATLTIIAIFATIKILSGGSILVLGNFFGNMGNPLGGWTDLAMASGLLSILTILALGIIPMKLSIKVPVYAIFALSVALLVVINFSTALTLTLGASVLITLYFLKIESGFLHATPRRQGSARQDGVNRRNLPMMILPLFLGLVSLLFLINPTISTTRGKLGSVVSGVFHVSNSDVRPTFSATLNISKAVLSQAGLLGSGPNTFNHDWLIFKPVNVNTTPFWGVAFPFGAGFIPTQIATTGILGTALWAIFLILLLTLAIRILGHIPDSRVARFGIIATLFTTLFIWIGALIYTPVAAIILLGFIFAGILVAQSHEAGIIGLRSINLKEISSIYFTSWLLGVAIILGSIYVGWAGMERTIAAYHFQKAIKLSNTTGISLPVVEGEIDKAISFAPLDTYYVALARINFSQAQAAATATTEPEANRALFQESLGKSIASAKSAVAANPAGFENWIMLGSIYSALVPAPLKVEGAYENATFAYNEAEKRNPNNPELPLFLAQLELNKGNIDMARSYLQKSIALKEDYADAYLMLAQLEIQEKNITGAIASTEVLSKLVPDNSGVHFELGLLKYSNQDYNGAEKSLTRALEISPDYANAKYYLALTLAKLGRTAEAKGYLEKLLDANPGNAELKQALKSLNVK